MRITRITGSALAGAILLALGTDATLAQAQRLAGTIVSVDGQTIVLKTAKGDDVRVSLARNGGVLAVEKITMEKIKVGEFIGVGAMPQADGTQRALRINVFDEARRGSNEGHRPGWGPEGKGTMTNATVGTTVGGIDGQVLMLKYAGGEKKVVVPPEAVIQRNLPGSAADLKPGAAVSISAATPKPDGSFETARINVGRDGYVPQ